MAREPEERRDARLLLGTWALLLAATAGAYGIAEAGSEPGVATVGLVVGIAAAKSHLVAGVFMELLRAPRIFCLAMSGFLLAQAALIVALFGWE